MPSPSSPPQARATPPGGKGRERGWRESERGLALGELCFFLLFSGSTTDKAAESCERIRGEEQERSPAYSGWLSVMLPLSE